MKEYLLFRLWPSARFIPWRKCEHCMSPVQYSTALHLQRQQRWVSSTTTTTTTTTTTNKTTTTVRKDHISVITRDGQWELPVTITGPSSTLLSSPSTTSSSTNTDASATTCIQHVIVFISGWTGISSDWGIIPKLIAGRQWRNPKQQDQQHQYDVITYDPRYLGQSKMLQSKVDDLTWDIMTDDVMSIIQHLKRRYYHNCPTRFSIVGASMGGLIAQQCFFQNTYGEIMRNDQLSSSLILISSAPMNTWGMKRYQVSPDFLNLFEKKNHDDDNSISQEDAQLFFHALGDDFLAKPGRLKLRDRLVQSFCQSRSTTGINQQRQLLLLSNKMNIIMEDNVDATDNPVKKIQPHCLILHGRHDSVIHPDAALAIKQELSSVYSISSRLVWFENSDHLLWITDGMRLVDEICHFLQENYEQGDDQTPKNRRIRKC